MNVIIANKKKELLDRLNIDIIKSLDGEYEVEELVGMFTNFFFNKMIIDVTAIKDYSNISKLQKLAKAIDMSKVILLISDSSIDSSKEFLSDIISLGIYNFTTTYEGVLELFNKPNTYEDIKKYHSDTSFRGNIKDDDDDDGPKEIAEYSLVEKFEDGLRVIGVQNLTDGAGATSLVVQMVKQLNVNYKAIGIEMNKQDFVFFNTPYLYSCTSSAEVLKKLKEHNDVDAVVVDLNNVDHKEFCTDVIYLVEPGIIKITKLIKRNGKAFEELSGEKIVLNRTNMDEKQVSEFEVESNVKIFSVVSNFRDNLDRVISVDRLLSKLGYTKCLDIENEANSVKRFSFFGKNK